MSAYYFGCVKSAGHYTYLPHGRSFNALASRSGWYPDGQPWANRLDGGLTPGERDEHGRLARLYQGELQPQSSAAFHQRDGWTAIAMHDYTVDSRGNSNSVFFFDEILDEATALARAAEEFPKIVKRITDAAPITIVERHVG